MDQLRLRLLGGVSVEQNDKERNDQLPSKAMALLCYLAVTSKAQTRGALAGLLTCTPALNASVNEANSEMPVLGYTVPYAISNVLLTLLGPVIVLTA